MKRPRALPDRTWVRWFCFVLFFTLSISALGLAGPNKSSAPTPTSAQPPTPPPEEPVEAGSPRAILSEYLALCSEGRYADAARYLDLAPTQAAKGPLLAKRLKAVIDHYVWIDLETISPLTHGNPNDGLPAAYDAIAEIPGASGKAEPVRIFRRAAMGGTPDWVVSRNTVEHIDAWYRRLPQVWFLENLPAWLLQRGARELLIWQWIAIPLLFCSAWAMGALLAQLTRWLIKNVTSRTSITANEQMLRRLRGPFTLVWALSLVYVALPWLGLYKPADEFTRSLLRGGYYFTFFWSVSRLIDGWGKAVAESPWANQRSSAKALVPIGVRLAKILLLIIAVVVLITAMGYPAASIVAGLGIGGLAVALAAQKTVENLFGAFTLGADEPFRVGDFVKIEDFVGTIESIGLRSTRIRTLDRTLITIPNGRLSELRIENFAARDRFRLACDLTLTYGTTAAQLREVIAGCESILRKHPKVWNEGITVRFKELGTWALVIEVMAWFVTEDWAAFQLVREQILLDFVAVVEGAGTSFAFPTQTIDLGSNPRELGAPHEKSADCSNVANRQNDVKGTTTRGA
ncbi:MAG: mechanosensitive ion channel family protein [Myxococcales bacterium]